MRARVKRVRLYHECDQNNTKFYVRQLGQCLGKVTGTSKVVLALDLRASAIFCR